MMFQCFFFKKKIKSSQTSWESLFGDYSPIDIDISGQSVEVEKIDFLPSDCLSDCQKKYEKEIQVFFSSLL